MDKRLTDIGARIGYVYELPSTGERYVYVGNGYFMEECDFESEGGTAYKASELVDEDAPMLIHIGIVEQWAIDKMKGNA